MNEEEQSLLRKARMGDESSFEKLIEDALPMLLGQMRRMLRDEDEAWEAAQEACLKAWKRIAMFRGEAKFSTWLCTIARNGAIDRIRKQSRIVESDKLEETLRDRGLSPEDVAEARGLKSAINMAVQGLPDGEREVFVLHHDSNLKYREISEKMGIAIGTVMSRLHSARIKLRASLEPWWNEIADE